MSDRRRNLGPEVSVRPVPDPAVIASLSPEEEQAALLDPSTYLRHDGRYPEQLRSLTVRPGVVGRAPGSAYVELGSTKLVCTVYGPRSSTARTAGKTFRTLGNVSCEMNFAPFSALKRLPHQPEAEEEDLSLLLLQAIVPAIRRELFPNSFVDLYITVLEQDGSILCAALCGATVALCQAGVEMLDLPLACQAIQLGDALFVMDPDGREERHHAAKHNGTKVTVAGMPNLGMVSQVHLVGRVEEPALMEAVALCLDGIRALYEGVVRPTVESLHNTPTP